MTKTNLSTAKETTATINARRYPATSSFIKRATAMFGTDMDAKKMSFEVFEAVRKEVTAAKFKNRTVVSTMELSEEVKALVSAVCSDKNVPAVIRKRVIAFFQNVAHFPLTAKGEWVSDDMEVKKITKAQSWLTKRAKGYEYQGVKYAAWEKYPAFFEETEKEPKEKKEAKQKTASELVDNLVEKLTKRELEEDVETIENLRLISSAPEVFKLVRTGHIDTEVLRWLAVPKNLEEVKTKMAEAAK